MKRAATSPQRSKPDSALGGNKSPLAVRERLSHLHAVIAPLAIASLIGLWALTTTASVFATEKISVRAGVSLEQERFQTYILMYALQDLGFRVQRERTDTYPALHTQVARGELTFIANHWAPLHSELLVGHEQDVVLAPTGRLVTQATQGYMVDRRTAAANGIRGLADLADPKTAALFDLTGDGKADLIGCAKSWSCAKVINHQLKAFDLAATVNHVQDDYDKRMLDVVARVRARRPVLFYAWTPYWVTSKLDPEQQVRWLDVPFSSLPPPRAHMDTAQPDGSNPGFVINKIQVVANPVFLSKHPVAAELFRLVRIPIEDVSYQNQQMQLGENSLPDIERHARQWIAANRSTYDQWLTAARKQ